MLAEISAALGSAKALLDITKAASDVTKQASIASISLDFSSKLFALTDKCNQLMEQNQSLKSEVAQLQGKIKKRDDFDLQANAYALKEVGAGAFAYVANDVTSPNESTHKYCPECFSKRKLSILQQSQGPERQIVLECGGCIARMTFARYITS
ncbi:hypothetical protein ACFOHU_15370 [Ottowia pentelensis]|uniref:Uncharacterized protein n=1 Tax=Ottowia pentelensis TaxID=511108 RepID=A0ABV6PT95_9BURK